MVINHICNENCFVGRGSRNKSTKCKLCDHLFNLNCFNVNITATKGCFEPDSHVIFICYKCHPYLTKQKSLIVGNRKSLTTLNPGNRRSSASTLSNVTTSNGSSANVDSHSQTQLLNKILSNLQQQSSQQQQSSTPDAQTIQYELINSNTRTIMDSQNELHSKSTRLIESLINEKLDSFKQIVTSSMVDYNKLEDIFIKNKCGNKIFNNKNISKVNNPLEWSFSSVNQSCNVSVNEIRPDLFQLWHSFEANTWTSLDNISHQVKMNSNKLDDISDRLMENESTIRNILSNNINRSALTETIQCDNFNPKVMDDIHRELCDLKQFISSISESQMEKEVINILDKNDTNLMSSSSSDYFGQLSNENGIVADDQVAVKTNTYDRRYSSAILKHSMAKRELYVSRFKTHITATHIEQYLTNKGISIDQNLRITPLINPKRDLSMLSFISFKIDTNEDTARIITNDDFWPSGCFIKDFRHKQSNSPTIIDENFLIPQVRSPTI